MVLCCMICVSDCKAPGRPVCSWWSSALLSVACGVDWTAGTACGAGAQSEAARSRGTLQFLHDSNSTTSRLRTVIVAYCSAQRFWYMYANTRVFQKNILMQQNFSTVKQAIVSVGHNNSVLLTPSLVPGPHGRRKIPSSHLTWV